MYGANMVTVAVPDGCDIGHGRLSTTAEVGQGTPLRVCLSVGCGARAQRDRSERGPDHPDLLRHDTGMGRQGE